MDLELGIPSTSFELRQRHTSTESVSQATTQVKAQMERDIPFHTYVFSEDQPFTRNNRIDEFRLAVLGGGIALTIPAFSALVWKVELMIGRFAASLFGHTVPQIDCPYEAIVAFRITGIAIAIVGLWLMRKTTLKRVADAHRDDFKNVAAESLKLGCWSRFKVRCLPCLRLNAQEQRYAAVSKAIDTCYETTTKALQTARSAKGLSADQRSKKYDAALADFIARGISLLP